MPSIREMAELRDRIGVRLRRDEFDIHGLLDIATALLLMHSVLVRTVERHVAAQDLSCELIRQARAALADAQRPLNRIREQGQTASLEDIREGVTEAHRAVGVAIDVLLPG